MNADGDAQKRGRPGTAGKEGLLRKTCRKAALDLEGEVGQKHREAGGKSFQADRTAQAKEPEGVQELEPAAPGGLRVPESEPEALQDSSAVLGFEVYP